MPLLWGIALASLLHGVPLTSSGDFTGNFWDLFSGWAFGMTALGILGAVATLFTGLYPRVMVSSPDFAISLTISNAASAHYTLAVMTVVAVIVTPVVLRHEGWTYYVFRARVTGSEVEVPAFELSSAAQVPRSTGGTPAA